LNPAQNGFYPAKTYVKSASIGYRKPIKPF